MRGPLLFRNLSSNIGSYLLIGAGTLVLLFQFNNCGEKISSQLDESASLAGPNTSSTNPYVLQCIQSSDGSPVSQSLKNSVTIPSGSGSGKINSLDWDQSMDLVLTFNSECLNETHFSEEILNYVDKSELSTEFSQAVAVVRKENVLNLGQFIKTALASECLTAAEKNFKFKIKSTDPYYSYQTHLQSSSANPLAISATDSVINSIQSYVNDPAYASNPKTVRVAVIDTGIDSTNPDLGPIIAKDSSNNFLGENTSGIGATTDFLSDSGWHGTHVSGLIAAKANNGYGVTGVAGQNVAIYPIKASGDGENFELSSLVKAVQRATAFQVDLINMSLGTTSDYTQLRTAINSALAANITVVVAAGNGDDSGNGQTLSSSTPLYPAMYSTSSNGVITVGSLDLATSTISSFSNRSSTYVDILAPGANTTSYSYTRGIVSTIPLKYNIGSTASPNFPAKSSTEGPGVGNLIDLKNGSAEIIQGTSMAAPIVTGALADIIAMARSHGKTIPNSQLKSWLRGGGSPKSSAFTNYSVNGNFLNLDILASYAKTQINALTGTSPSPTPTPSPSPAPAPAPSPTPMPPPPPASLVITQQPLPLQAVIGETVKFSVSATSSQSISYQWYKNNTAISGATSKDLTLTNLKATQGGSYKVYVTSAGSTLVSNSVNLTVAFGYCN
jgi:hypothetical protein